MYQQTPGRTKLVITIVVVIVFFVIINLPSARNMWISRAARKMVLTAVYPVQYVLSGVSSGAMGFLGDVGGLWGASEENHSLREEVASLSAELSLAENLAAENDELRKDLGFKKSNPFNFPLIAVDVISRAGSNWFEAVFINKGSADGLSVDQVVISKDGLVGRITEVGRFSSKVMLITDPDSSVGVLKKGSGDLGIMVGGAMSSLQMKYVGASSNIGAGDQVLTSGVGGIFPKGIPVGTVTKTSVRDYDIFKYVEIKPFTDFSRLNRLFVISK